MSLKAFLNGQDVVTLFLTEFDFPAGLGWQSSATIDLTGEVSP